MDDVTILKDVRGTDAEQKTLLIRGGHIAWIGSELPPGVRDVPVFSGGGGLLLPALVDAHEHVDMTLWGMPWRPSTARDGSIEAFVENERAYRLGLPPVADRMRGVIDALVASGTLLVRSHTQVDPEIGLGNVEALLGVREEFRDRVSLQIVAFPQFGILSEAGTADLMEEAVRMGAEVVGGIDPGESDDDSKGHLDSRVRDRRSSGMHGGCPSAHTWKTRLPADRGDHRQDIGPGSRGPGRRESRVLSA